MHTSFGTLDWIVVAIYFSIVIATSFAFSRTKIDSSRDFFVTKNHMSIFAVAISVIATSQSTATFLGAPEYSFGKDFTFIGFYVSGVLGALFVAFVLVPKFYAMQAVTVYELLENRYGAKAKREAGVMFLVGRTLASGARLYIGALAISMILFGDILFAHIALSIVVLIFFSIAYTYFGGIRSIILSDIVQAAAYLSAAVVVAGYLLYSLQNIDILELLQEHNKLVFVDTSLDGEFSVLALLSGWLLLNIAAYGLDQDLTQRVLCCKNKGEAAKSLLFSTILTVPIVLIFLLIGALLYLFYLQTPIEQSFHGEKITVFMYYILSEMPDGLKGIAAVGAIATALSSTTSVLGAMASVIVEDLYKPWKTAQGVHSEAHFLKASRVAVVGVAIALSSMAMASYFWQHYSNLSLIGFALGVMAFAYAGLLGVYFSAIFTTRGSETAVFWALAGGFFTVLALQPYTFGLQISFAVQMVSGTAVAFLTMQLGGNSLKEK